MNASKIDRYTAVIRNVVRSQLWWRPDNKFLQLAPLTESEKRRTC